MTCSTWPVVSYQEGVVRYHLLELERIPHYQLYVTFSKSPVPWNNEVAVMILCLLPVRRGGNSMCEFLIPPIPGGYIYLVDPQYDTSPLSPLSFHFTIWYTGNTNFHTILKSRINTKSHALKRRLSKTTTKKLCPSIQQLIMGSKGSYILGYSTIQLCFWSAGNSL